MTEYKSIIFELTYPTDNFPTNTFTRKPWLSLTDDQFSLYSELIKKYQPSFDNTLTLNEQINNHMIHPNSKRHPNQIVTFRLLLVNVGDASPTILLDIQ